jgi:spore cortex biosynthesis protein YabQ
MLVGTGMLAGFYYDVYKVMRSALKFKKAGTCLGDIFFWLSITAIAFYLLLYKNSGEVRVYVFVGLALGALLYMQLLSSCACRILMRCLFITGKILNIVLAFFAFVWKIITAPIKIIYLIAAFPFRLLGRVYSRAGRAVKRIAGGFLSVFAGKMEKGLLLRLKIILKKLKPPG